VPLLSAGVAPTLQCTDEPRWSARDEETMSSKGEEEGVKPTGRFRVYLGAAAGVGKTCAMLDEGWRRFQRGADVVVGFVETHKRAYTIEQIRDLPVVRRKQMEYRGATWEEMDLDAVLARKPEVALIDELAHTNVPGSGRHEKRWEDVLQILDAGIAVITTVNIQHIESLADPVERISGVSVRERVPDWVVRKADQIELIDSSADQLRRRMLHGNIYPEEKVPSALNGFFRAENLVALRELSLRFVADETEEELLEFLRSRGAAGELWETTERIMVAVTGAPGNASVIRRAARIAARVKAPLVAINVVSSDADARRPSTAELEALVKAVGGTWETVQGDDVAKTIFAAAVDQQITQIVLGTTRLTRWQSLTRGSVIQQILRMASDNDIDVHVIARRDELNGRPAADDAG
jgi:two-component system sensor histidine kinase KdpD